MLGYPMIETVHVVALTGFLGLAIMFDLRLLGLAFRKVRVSEVAARLLPWEGIGFAVMVISGALLFYAIPVRTYENIFFRIKVAALLLAGLNALVFHSSIWLKVSDWDMDPRPPARARIAGTLSLALWAVIVVCGRMIAYGWFD